jgi:hypothetical protein
MADVSHLLASLSRSATLRAASNLAALVASSLQALPSPGPLPPPRQSSTPDQPLRERGFWGVGHIPDLRAAGLPRCSRCFQRAPPPGPPDLRRVSPLRTHPAGRPLRDPPRTGRPRSSLRSPRKPLWSVGGGGRGLENAKLAGATLSGGGTARGGGIVAAHRHDAWTMWGRVRYWRYRGQWGVIAIKRRSAVVVLHAHFMGGGSRDFHGWGSRDRSRSVSKTEEEHVPYTLARRMLGVCEVMKSAFCLGTKGHGPFR